ncbi:MAG: nitrite/sulfite reductase [Alphaproteobacteria bacterium]|nr:nitrite/sulfite reductase [Alphaproteobacteria bacterium]
MYRYDEFDQKVVEERVEQFRGQVARRLSGELSEDEFKPLRLMNGLYLQLHAYMLRVAIPYGTLSSRQMRALAHIARKYDRGYGHFTTRQNLQYNWPKLADVPKILADLATVEMHCIQTSGNCIRNVTADHFAGASADEVDDPRIWSEIIRQWSTFHPEFSYLPRKFKIAVTAAPKDRAAIKVHDIGIIIRRKDDGALGPGSHTSSLPGVNFDVYVGGGQGRTPMIGHCIGEGIAPADLLAYLEAVMRVYNLYGRRDNIYKARIKILVHQIGAAEMKRQVEAEFAEIKQQGALELPKEEIERIRRYFAPPAFEDIADEAALLTKQKASSKGFAAWVDTNVSRHKVPGYAIATISLKPIGGVPGDASAEQMEIVADLADRLSFDEIRVSHEQNLVLPHVRQRDLFEIWQTLDKAGLATANAGLISDIIACPGLDYCDLANARSINVAQALSKRFADLERQNTIGELKIKISGCINACGHHHVGHIGVLGVDKKGVEYYQITLGGSGDETASLGEIIGPAFGEHDVADAVETIVGTYLNLRGNGERFLDTYRRVGIQPFREKLYAAH